ncbi:MAG TPA: tetratricopeptide repeat protein [Gemmatimonadaceae bacterium]|nr:tetratricopeptide repeat protein [Gemmatimonadaceae bacterium]
MPAPAKVEESRRLFTLGQEASVVGDHRVARDLFQQAAQLNAADERVPYYLGRSLEELKQTPQAVAQYCRYLTLAPTGFDADDVRARLDRLGGGDRSATLAAGKRSAAATRFRAAVDAADRGRASDAERGFGDVIAQLPNAAEAYYDRGVVRATRRDFGGAAADLERYLALRPAADDAPAVRERLELLRRAATSPTMALTGGLVVPGFGQFYTGQPVLGLAVIGGVAGGVYYALRQSPQQRTTTYPKPFGGTYDVIDTIQVRKNKGAGLAIAGGAALIGAIEGYAHAQQRRTAATRFADGRTPLRDEAASFAINVSPAPLRDEATGAATVGVALGGRLSF